MGRFRVDDETPAGRIRHFCPSAGSCVFKSEERHTLGPMNEFPHIKGCPYQKSRVAARNFGRRGGCRYGDHQYLATPLMSTSTMRFCSTQ
jgi:hypothetical protein